ncbi:COG4315 family predicted lipoprotein [Streptomyces violaceusniger]
MHDGAGFTLYRFDKDSSSPSKSNCNQACAVTWPPVLVGPGSRIFVDGVPTAEIGIVTRADGTRQVTIGGWPIYRFSKDTAPGNTNREGVGGTWFAISTDGQKVLSPAAGSGGSASSSAPSTPTAGTSSATLGNGSVILDSGVNFSEPNGSVGEAGPGCKTLVQPFQTLSVQLSGGPIKIWTGANCSGTSHVISTDAADLSATGFTQPIASIRFGD